MANTSPNDAIEKQLEAEQQRLEELQQSLRDSTLGQSQEPEVELSTADQHPADVATDTSTREINETLQRLLESREERFAAARAKIEAGTYGICERCGQQINPARLRARPDSIYCIDCQRIVEAEAP